MQMPLTRSQAVTVLLADDHPLMRKGLRTLLESEDNLTVVGEASNGEEAIEQVRALSPNIVVMDVTMPDMNGIEATRRIMADVPDTRVIALSIHSEKRFVEDMLKAGAAGYVLKDSVPEELVQAMHAVLRGEAFLSAPILGTVVAGYHESDAALLQTADSEVATALPILQTKLHRPAIPPDLVSRPRLLERLDSGRVKPLTLIAAPAGYGKSVLISTWLEHCDWPSAWLSLDKDDSDLRQFLFYFVAAVQSIFTHACEEILDLAKASQLPTVPALVSSISNELDAFDQPFILVIDDYHLIDVQSPVNELLQLLLDHPPIPLHLVIMSRRDPALSLVALRAGGQVNELRMQDLRFDTAEARAMLQGAAEFTASNDAIAVLDRELEGWAVGLRLVSLAVRQSKDPEGFLKHLHGGLQQTQEYIIQEVIAGLQQPLRNWLLKIAILDRFCALLCDAVCIEEGAIEASGFDGSEFVKAVLGGNLFTISLDARGEWFRFHHLFQEFLRRVLSRQLAPGEIAALHLRASGWFESQGLFTEAIEHALAAADVVRAAEIVEANRDEEFVADRWYVVDQWLAMLPAEIKRERPKLLLTEAWIRYLQHLLARIPMLLDRAESLLRSQTAEPVALAEIAYFRGYIAYFEGDAEQSMKYLENTVSTLAGTKSPILADTELMLGLVRCMNGNKDLAIQVLESRLGEIDSSGPYLRCRLIASLAYIHMLSGDLYQLQKEGQRLLDVSKKHKMMLAEAWGYYFLAFGYLHTGKLETALPHFVQVDKLCHVMEPRAAIDALAGLALTQQFLQREVEAEKSIQRLQEYVRELNERSYFPLAQSCQARLSLLRGDVNSAVDWSRSVEEPPVTAELFSWFEAPAITQARALIADGSEESLLKAVKQIQSIRDLCEANRFTCQTIEVTVLQSLLFEKQGHSDAALKSLEEAVVMAEPGGWIRPFVELGRPMKELLERLEEQKGSTDFLRRVRETFVAMLARTQGVAAGTHTSGAAGETWGQEPLTRRELDILELLVQRLQNKEIASRLCVSPETVKTHLKHLYQKLDVSNRREAAARATEILESTRPA